jgi:hypothetical protein
MNMLGMFCPANCKGTGRFGNLIVDWGIILKRILRIKMPGCGQNRVQLRASHCKYSNWPLGTIQDSDSVDSWRSNSFSITDSDSLSGILIIWVAGTTFACNITTGCCEHSPQYHYRLVWTLAEVFLQAVVNTGPEYRYTMLWTLAEVLLQAILNTDWSWMGPVIVR